MQITELQEQQLAKKKIELTKLQQQLINFDRGFKPANLQAAATVGNGIKQFSPTKTEELIALYLSKKAQKNIVNFVPASGAATRMFKFLFEAYNKQQFFDDGQLEKFFSQLHQFPFYSALQKSVGEYLPNDKNYRNSVIQTLLFESPFKFAEKPKGLIPFHQYNGWPRLAFEEHFFEAKSYAENNNTIRLHFTISEEHKEGFEHVLQQIKHNYKVNLNLQLDVTFSYQQGHTDIVAVYENHQPVYTEDGSFLFRPGGHGALIENLNNLTEDLIIIKNIDNVLPPFFAETLAKYKQLLAGYLLQIEHELFDLQKRFSSLGFSEQLQAQTQAFAKKFLDVKDGLDLNEAHKLNAFLFKPLRVCGMVKNEGEPGGGPFWVKNSLGETSLQIVEKSQIDTSIPKQNEILNQSTHFNPVDLVCSVKNFAGTKYNLHQFVDTSTGFITEKSYNGKTIKAQELPGLWNGAMANWHTIFVEVPLITFNPVKTINDLLKPNHLKSE